MDVKTLADYYAAESSEREKEDERIKALRDEQIDHEIKIIKENEHNETD